MYQHTGSRRPFWVNLVFFPPESGNIGVHLSRARTPLLKGAGRLWGFRFSCRKEKLQGRRWDLTVLPHGITPFTLIPTSNPKLCLNPCGLEAFRGSPLLFLAQTRQQDMGSTQSAGNGAAEEQPLCSLGPLVNCLLLLLSSAYGKSEANHAQDQ